VSLGCARTELASRAGVRPRDDRVGLTGCQHWERKGDWGDDAYDGALWGDAASLTTMERVSNQGVASERSAVDNSRERGRGMASEHIMFSLCQTWYASGGLWRAAAVS
jgi:hypothetical protein